MSEIDDILAQRDAARASVTAAIRQLNDAKLAIMTGAAGRDLNDAEKAKVRTLDDGMATLARTDAALALQAVERLNNSASAKALAASLDQINKDLTAKTDEIKGVSATITAIGEVTQKIDGILQGVLALAATAI